MGRKQDYFSIRKTIPAGEYTGKIPVQGQYFAVLDNSILTNPFVSVEGGANYEIPAGVGIPTPQPFNWLEFHNPSATQSMDLWIAVAQERIDDARTIVTASEGYGQIPVSDVSFVLSTLRDDLDTFNQLEGLHVPANAIQIDTAALTNEGGGKIGIPLTSNPFYNNSLGCNYVGQNIRINSAAPSIDPTTKYPVDSSSTSSKIVITESYSAYTFQAGDTVSLWIPRKIAANASRNEVHIYNPDASNPCFYGGEKIGWDYYGVAGITPLKGCPIPPESTVILTCQDDIFLVADDAFGAGSAILQVNEFTKV